LLAVFSRLASRLCDTLLAGRDWRKMGWACESGVRIDETSEGRYDASDE
jgi:hypothetical protein